MLTQGPTFALMRTCHRPRRCLHSASVHSRSLCRRRHSETGLPSVEINAAAVELCLTNYFSNAIKYCDPAKPARFAKITAEIGAMDRVHEIILRVRDNSLRVMRGRLT